MPGGAGDVDAPALQRLAQGFQYFPVEFRVGNSNIIKGIYDLRRSRGTFGVPGSFPYIKRIGERSVELVN